ncbi:RagB/SusD family nutrient uptake outer membrane protein [Dyadobacter pollutisoli]|uniref:RagB/SusD family nutrient uptake outer membrane protein n=1 Tax=Dyadobacter pollutisoli TaxID=2910158 RepID=A0A9E8NHW8_9BACT|nr:RagB/SusD family nutrient uptake outer membrane protein [Dyadobacter pollutisoli]WAC14592.1 RagB/SusD family nutrient uptake outer membrane protein [Dyadobacter pollutisoli]
MNELFSVPQVEIDRSGGSITQNPNYWHLPGFQNLASLISFTLYISINT